MGKIFQQGIADIGVALDTNYMISNVIQNSISFIVLRPVYWSLTHINEIQVRLKGNSTIRTFALPSPFSSPAYCSSPYSNSFTDSQRKDFLVNNIFSSGSFATSYADAMAAKTSFNSATELQKYVKFGAISGSSDIWFAANANGVANGGVLDPNTMVEWMQVQINADDDNANISLTTFTPMTLFNNISTPTSKAGTIITL